jgi:asparagine synthase (glutamine-hydrolysing)
MSLFLRFFDMFSSMCGIGGVWNLRGERADGEAFDRFLDAMSHRGPDGRGVYADGGGALLLGHRRLRIVDLSDAASQPMTCAAGRYWIVFNGEVYNFVELREELRAHGFSFRTQSDTEVVLAAYAHWGEACLLKFNGMWAFALWDSRERTLFLARDRFGVKPLYYYHTSEQVVFASEMKAFLHAPGVKCVFDEEAIAQAIDDANALEATERCLWKGMKKLQAGCCATATAEGGLRVRRWWNTLDHLEEPPASWEEKVERFRYLLEDACKIRLRSDVPVGSAVSGGLDSSSVFALLGGARAFVALYPGTSQDEKTYAEEIVKHVGAPAVYCSVDAHILVQQLDRALFQFEEIFELPIGPWRLYEAYRQHGVVVSIDGHGADELLGGYHHHADTVLCSNLRRVRDLLSLRRKLYPAGAPPLWKSLARERLPRAVALYRRARGRSWLSFQPPVRQETPLSLAGALNRRLYDDFHRRTLPAILRNFDRASMAHGVEMRAPFLDWRVVCYAFSLPDEAKIGNGCTKRILREAMKGALPEEIRMRTSKVGFASPMVEWLRGALKPFVLDAVNSRSFLSSPIWKGPAIRDHVEKCYRSEDIEGVRGCWEYVQADRLMELYAVR